MKIVFIKDVPKIGKKNDIKEVADGYARFLLSSGAAVLATSSSLSRVQNEKEKKETLKQKSAEEFKNLTLSLKDVAIVIHAKVNSGKHLFGAIHQDDIAKEIKHKTGILVNPKNIKIEKAIKEVGKHQVAIVEGTMHFDLMIEVKEQ